MAQSDPSIWALAKPQRHENVSKKCVRNHKRQSRIGTILIPNVQTPLNGALGEPSTVWEELIHLQSYSLSQDRKILLRRSQNSPCSENPEFEPSFDQRMWDSCRVARTIHHFSLVSLDRLCLFLCNRFFHNFSISLAISCATVLEESASHFQFST